MRQELGDRGLADDLYYPFVAIVGQREMKLALLLSLINRHIGGVLLIGPRGTAKTTAVRGLIDLMPTVRRSTCHFGCEEEAAFNLGMDAICNDCAVKIGMGEPITYAEPMRLIELPLNARLEDVIGGLDERIAIERKKVYLNRGILSHADQNLLYIDEVNLLDNNITNAILDASAQGLFSVRRGAMVANYRSRLFLVGSMNPEEGNLRPQIQDRFGLRVLVTGLTSLEERLKVYRRSVAYKHNPHKFYAEWLNQTIETQEEIEQARERLPNVKFEKGLEEVALKWIHDLKITSHRAEITLLEAARALAAADERELVTMHDLQEIAYMALRQRQSEFITDYVKRQESEDNIIHDTIKRDISIG
ncbi:MAG: hypothetical protein B6242_13470 [Anaerolineaceae bacterium 4572_78]|nr:MAG: hypothetical protein B6242_13470 [Anaerolineaceae bacterium 4572_78]